MEKIAVFTLMSNLGVFGSFLELKMPPESDFKALPSFWKNSGFCPPAPIDNASQFLLSNDVATNLKIVGSNPGIKSVRVHWLLQLITDRIDYSNLDQFLALIYDSGLMPAFEIMGNPLKESWSSLVRDLLSRYEVIYGATEVSQWQFETWNEPDLKTYNTMNWTLSDYEAYVRLVKKGLNGIVQLRGPAGLFKSRAKHKFCWEIIEICGNNITKCPFDEITFHRKGITGTSSEITAGTKGLIQELIADYPALKELPFSNNEADPISGWSVPREFQADMGYAAILVETVLQHWNLIYRNEVNLKSISHDNAFLSYHPYEFDQRTLLARFQMNHTQPPHTQFVQKPVFGALGLLANLGELAAATVEDISQNLTYLITKNRPNESVYVGIIVVLNRNLERKVVQMLTVSDLKLVNETCAYFVEILQANLTDPVKAWRAAGSPAYPNAKLRDHMRRLQTPAVLQPPTLLDNKSLIFDFNQTGATVLSIRICGATHSAPLAIKNLRIVYVNSKEILLLWHVADQESKCIQTFEVFQQSFISRRPKKWINIARHWHLPFGSFHYRPKRTRNVYGKYKVRAIDLFGRPGEFSNIAVAEAPKNW